MRKDAPYDRRCSGLSSFESLRSGVLGIMQDAYAREPEKPTDLRSSSILIYFACNDGADFRTCYKTIQSCNVLNCIELSQLLCGKEVEMLRIVRSSQDD